MMMGPREIAAKTSKSNKVHYQNLFGAPLVTCFLLQVQKIKTVKKFGNFEVFERFLFCNGFTDVGVVNSKVGLCLLVHQKFI